MDEWCALVFGALDHCTQGSPVHWGTQQPGFLASHVSDHVQYRTSSNKRQAEYMRKPDGGSPGIDDGLGGISLLGGEGHFVGIVTDRASDDAEGEQRDQRDQERYDAARIEAHRGTEDVNDDPRYGRA